MFVWRLCWAINHPIDLFIPFFHPFTLILSLTLSFSSPIGGLQIRYDSSGSLPGPGLLGTGGSGEMMPPVATSIEQLLERQWNEGQNFLMQQGAQGDGEEAHTHTNTHSRFCKTLPKKSLYPAFQVCLISHFLSIDPLPFTLPSNTICRLSHSISSVDFSLYLLLYRPPFFVSYLPTWSPLWGPWKWKWKGRWPRFYWRSLFI